MALVESRAVVLRRHQLGETSRVVVCYTRDYGKVRLVAKGSRKGGGRLGAALEPFVVSGVVFYLRPERPLALASRAEVELEFPAIRRDVTRQAYAAVVLELTDKLVADRAPDPELFDLLVHTLREVERSPEEDLDATLWRFELLLADALGYAPELEACVACGRAASEGSRFSPELGGVICDECPPRGARTFGPDVAGALRELKSGAPPGAYRSMSDTQREEAGEAILGHLGRHAGRELNLKALSVLQSIQRASRVHRRRALSDEDAN